MNLSGQSAITVEFWLKWNAYGNNDALAMELTPNYNENLRRLHRRPQRRRVRRDLRRRASAPARSRNSVFFAGRAPACGTTTPSC